MAGIGDFNFLGSYQAATPSITPTGGREFTYAESLQAWGKLRRSSGSRTTNSELQVNSSWTWECHFSSAITIDIKSRWVINGKTYTIEDYELIDQKREFYRFRLLAVE